MIYNQDVFSCLCEMTQANLFFNSFLTEYCLESLNKPNPPPNLNMSFMSNQESQSSHQKTSQNPPNDNPQTLQKDLDSFQTIIRNLKSIATKPPSPPPSSNLTLDSSSPNPDPDPYSEGNILIKFTDQKSSSTIYRLLPICYELIDMFGASQNLIDDSFSSDTQTPGKPPKLGPNLGPNGKKMSIDTVGKVSMTLKFVVDEV